MVRESSSLNSSDASCFQSGDQLIDGLDLEHAVKQTGNVFDKMRD